MLKVTAAEGLNREGSEALKRGEHALAIELFSKAIKLFSDPDIPNNGEGVYTSRATVYIYTRQF